MVLIGNALISAQRMWGEEWGRNTESDGAGMLLRTLVWCANYTCGVQLACAGGDVRLWSARLMHDCLKLWHGLSGDRSVGCRTTAHTVARTPHDF
jgi:hypothetical protein